MNFSKDFGDEICDHEVSLLNAMLSKGVCIFPLDDWTGDSNECPTLISASRQPIQNIGHCSAVVTSGNDFCPREPII